MLIEKNQITSGTTWHDGSSNNSKRYRKPNKISTVFAKLYDELEKETGQATGFIQCGSIQLATNKDKVEEMRRECAMAALLV